MFLRQANNSRRKYTISGVVLTARAENWALFQLKAAEGNCSRALQDVRFSMEKTNVIDHTNFVKLNDVERRLRQLTQEAYSLVIQIQSNRLSKGKTE